MSNKLNPSDKLTEIGKVPGEWQVVRLEQVIKEIKNGFASGKRDDNGIVQIRMNNVTTDGHLIFDSFLKVPAPENINEFLLEENDLLFNNTNSIGLVGKSTISKDIPFPCTFSNHFTRIRFGGEVLPEWVLFHFIRLWKKGFFRSVAIRHVGQAAVQTKYLTSLKLPLPPLFEQKKIAEILSTVDQAIEKVGEAIEKTQKLKKGLMQELLTKGIGHKDFKDTEIGRIPKTWRVMELGETANVRYGLGQPPALETNGIPMIRATNVKRGEIVREGLIFINRSAVPNSRDPFLREGDILVVRSGAYTGDVALVTKEWEGAVAGYDLIVTPSDTIDSKFLTYYLLSSPVQKRYFMGLKVRSAQPHLNSSQVEETPIPIVPLPEQQKIAEILGTVDERLDMLKKRKGRLSKIKKGLMNDLLTGKVRVNA